jgi:hypothetical protein
LHRTADGHSIFICQKLGLVTPATQHTIDPKKLKAFVDKQQDDLLSLISDRFLVLKAKIQAINAMPEASDAEKRKKILQLQAFKNSRENRAFIAGAFLMLSLCPPEESALLKEIEEGCQTDPVLADIFKDVKELITTNMWYKDYKTYHNEFTHLDNRSTFFLVQSQLKDPDNKQGMLREIGDNLLYGKVDTACAPGAHNKIMCYGALKAEGWWVFPENEKNRMKREALTQIVKAHPLPISLEKESVKAWKSNCLKYAADHRMTGDIARAERRPLPNLILWEHLNEMLQYVAEHPGFDISSMQFLEDLTKLQYQHVDTDFIAWGKLDAENDTPLKQFVRLKLEEMPDPEDALIDGAWTDEAMENFVFFTQRRLF